MANGVKVQQLYALSMCWFSQWDAYVKGQTSEPPCAIDNSAIAFNEGAVAQGICDPYNYVLYHFH